MAQKETQKKKKEMALGKMNYRLLAVAFVVVVIGFVLMTGGGNNDPEIFDDSIYSFRRITLAPILVLFGFLFGIYAIMKKPRDTEEGEKE